MKNFLLAALALGFTTSTWADVILPKVVSNKMILQCGVEVPIWGWADQGEAVTVSFAGQTRKAVPGEKGRWVVKLDPLTASSESRVMTIKGTNEITLDDVLVGEVWLASGQSNMEWAFRHIDPEERDYAAQQKDNKLVRAFHVNAHITAGFPLDDTVGRWKDGQEMVGEPGISLGLQKGISAVGFFFGLKLQQELGVPVAFIDTNWGGRRIESLIPDEGYEALGLAYRKGGVPKHDVVRRQLEQTIVSPMWEAHRVRRQSPMWEAHRVRRLPGRSRHTVPLPHWCPPHVGAPPTLGCHTHSGQIAAHGAPPTFRGSVAAHGAPPTLVPLPRWVGICRGSG